MFTGIKTIFLIEHLHSSSADVKGSSSTQVCVCLTSNISSRQTSMRQWPAWGCCWESSCRRIFSFCTRSLLYLGTVRHSASSGSWAGDRGCWGAPGPPWSFTWGGWLEGWCGLRGGRRWIVKGGQRGQRRESYVRMVQFQWNGNSKQFVLSCFIS